MCIKVGTLLEFTPGLKEIYVENARTGAVDVGYCVFFLLISKMLITK